MFNRGHWFGERKNLRIGVFVFSVFVLLFMVPTVHAFLWSETINVEPKGKEALTLNRAYGEIVSFRIWSINGTFDDSINIWVTNPSGDVILDLGTVRVTKDRTIFEFHTWQDGAYTVHFDNSFSSSPKSIDYMWTICKDTMRPAYYAGFSMWVVLPFLVKRILGFDWLKTVAVSFGTTALVMAHLLFILYVTSPLII